MIDPWYAYIGTDEFHNRQTDTGSKKMDIDRIIRHIASYKNDGYKTYGGYDISLLRLRKPVQWVWWAYAVAFIEALD